MELLTAVASAPRADQDPIADNEANDARDADDKRFTLKLIDVVW